MVGQRVYAKIGPLTVSAQMFTVLPLAAAARVMEAAETNAPPTRRSQGGIPRTTAAREPLLEATGAPPRPLSVPQGSNGASHLSRDGDSDGHVDQFQRYCAQRCGRVWE